MPRRLSGKPSKQSRNDPRRVSSGRIHAPNRIPRFLRIPDLPLERGFIPTVAFGTHRNGRNRDSFAFRTAARWRPLMAIAARLWQAGLTRGGSPGNGGGTSGEVY